MRRENISRLIDVMDKYITDSTEVRNTFEEYTYNPETKSEEGSLFDNTTTEEKPEGNDRDQCETE